MINHLIGFHPSFGLLTMRIVLGTIFILHGYTKLLKKNGRQQISGVPAPEMMTTIIGMVEFLGGIFIAAGFYTRLAAAANVITIFVTVLIMKKTVSTTPPMEKKWAGGYELAVALGTMALILVMMGAGKFSLDVIILNEW